MRPTRSPSWSKKAWIPAFAGVSGLLLLAVAQPGQPAPTPAGKGGEVAVDAAPVALDPKAPERQDFGDFRYAGGLQLASPDTSRLHGVSDLKATADGRWQAVTDDGDLVSGRLELDAGGRLTGVSQVRLTAIPGEDGQPANARGKQAADAEGLALLPSGDRLVSFEGEDRILRLPKDGGPARRAPSPDARFPRNFGMEALAADPARGEDAYVVGGEVSGQTWLCRLSAGCAEGPKVDKSPLWGLTAVAPLPGGRTAFLLRYMATWFGQKARLRIVGTDGRTIDELALDPPLTTDNFEGLAAVPQDDGRVRFYLVSDDNFAPQQRTLLLAFDWPPPQAEKNR